MKPDDVCGREMDGEDWLPQQLFDCVGFLVLEARTPHGATAKGRVEGPHCPTTQNQTGHQCSRLSEECRNAEQVRRQMDLLWRNGIPMCIEASLYPRCPHGLAEARSIHTESGASGLSTDENRVLLERWTIQVLPKRHVDKPELSVTPRFLLQAVRSFLHFSQLSAWLTSTQGKLPYPIAYRLFAPGDNVWDDFSQKTDTHCFPQADVNQVTVHVSVESIPRLPTIPNVLCRFTGDTCASVFGKQKAEYGSSVVSQSVHRKSSCYGEALGADSTNYNNNGIGSRTVCVSDRQSAQSCSGIQSSSDVKIQGDTVKWQHNPNGATQVLSAKPKVKLKDLDFTVPPVSKNPLKGHNLLTSAKRKDSPKVLFTSSANVNNAPPVYQKRFLDFDKSDSDSESNGSEKTCGWEGLKLASHLQSMSPGFPARNSTEDLEAYLSTLAECSLWREEQLKNIPIRKCKFFIGDKLDDGRSPSETDVSSLSQTPKQPVKADELAIDNLCKNLFKQSFQETLVDKKQLKKPSLSHKLEEVKSQPDNAESPSLCDKLNNSYLQQQEKNQQSKSDFNSNSPVSGTSHNCGSISMQTYISPDTRRFKRRQTVPNDLVEITSERRKIQDNTTASDGATHNSVISNGAIVKPTSLSISRGHETPSLSMNRGPDSPTVFTPQTKNGFTPDGRDSLHTSFLKNSFSHLDKTVGTLPSPAEISSFHHHLEKSTSMVFNTSTGLPSRSSPAPIKKKSSGKFDYDSSLINSRAIKNAISCSKLSLKTDDKTDDNEHRSLSTSAPASTNSLLGNFEESVLNGRIEPIGVVDGFTAEIGASGAFCPKHITLPVTSYFFSLSDDNAPSPYLGHINLDINKRRGYHVPKSGTVQVTLFNPNKTVVKMFVVRYDLSEMPANCQTFLRQRTLYTPVNKERNIEDTSQPSFLRYLIHLRFVSSKSGKIYLHTDIRLIFARDKFEFDPRVATYELRSFTEGPRNPKFSPKR